jgi:hypothetical protein
MGTADENDDRLEAFVLLRGAAMEEFERVIRVIESARGRVMHAIAPIAVMAFLPPASLDELRAHPAVALVETGPVGDEHREHASPGVSEAIYVWNEHLHSRRPTGGRRGPEQPVSWDSPGRLPPDPPRRVLEELRRRERK